MRVAYVRPLSSEPSGTLDLVALLLRNWLPFEAALGFTRPFEGSVAQFKDTVDGALGQTSVATSAALLPFVRYPTVCKQSRQPTNVNSSSNKSFNSLAISRCLLFEERDGWKE